MKLPLKDLPIRILCITSAISCALPHAAATDNPIVVRWSTCDNIENPDGSVSHTERFAVHAPQKIKRLCFNRLPRPMYSTDPVDTIGEIIPGYYFIATPRFAAADSVTVEVSLPWAFDNYNWKPDGFHALLTDGSVVPVQFSCMPLTRSAQWSTPSHDPMPRGEDIYKFNESLSTSYVAGPYDVIPSFKHIRLQPDVAACPVTAPVTTKRISSEYPDFYRFEIGPDSITISYTTPESLAMARRVLAQRIIPQNPGGLPQAVIEDYPSLPYRGMMMDIARNYFDAATLRGIADILASYRMNTLHLHPFDDEGWRIEIPGLPELTEIGARRGYTVDEKDCLGQLFCGDGNPNTTRGTGNGHLTRQEFIDLLRYCKELGIRVIPEIESPGHARAAIKAMQARAALTGDSTYLLTEGEADKSVYTSAQDFHDNVMNPALPGTYRFMGKVFDELIAMYKDAGVELPGIHIGGDEVPAACWDKSPAVGKMMKSRGLRTQREVHAAFVDSVASMLADRGVAMYGWQEIANDHSTAYNRHVAPLTGGVNCWTGSDQETAAKALEAGFPVIVSCVDRFYLDQTYSNHPMEKGLNWGGNVDEFTTLSGEPRKIGIDWEKTTEAGGRVIGISGHLFGETLRCRADIHRMILPKLAGLAERAWNPDATYSPAQFNAIVGSRELPRMASENLDFHLRQPGIRIADSRIMMNSPYPDAEIRYTLDGSDPTPDSPKYTEPLPMTPQSAPRARLFYLGHSSTVTRP